MKQFLLIFCSLFFSFLLKANNISVSNVSLVNQDIVNNTWQVKFDISWNNSWRTSTNESNWDAAWIFIKYRPSYSTEWKHAYLNANGHVLPAGADLDIKNGVEVTVISTDPVNGTGAILYRNSDGIGNISFTGAELKWKYGTAISDNDKVEISIYAIEMVYVPQGSFAIGDASSTASLFHFTQAGPDDLPFVINSENAITLGGNSPSFLMYSDESISNSTRDDFGTNTTKVLPATYPKGFLGFYCMKYECSMGQYVDFLNSLKPLMAEARFSGATTFGHTIVRNGNIYSTSTPERACNFISPNDVLAYADWSGLRPISEFEYEKASRGILTPVPGEYAGGVTSFQNLPGLSDLSFPGAANEQFGLLSPGAKMVSFATFQRPLRCGILAGGIGVNFTRASTGGSYYGIMDLSSNLGEICIAIGDETQRYFTRESGSGEILYDLTNWQGIIDFDNGCVRGFTEARIQTVSDRAYNAFLAENSRAKTVGFRCVIN